MAFSATDAAFEGFRLTREKPWAVVGWAIFYVLATALIGAVLMAVLGPAVVEQASARSAPPQDMADLMAMFGTLGPVLAVAVPLGLVVNTMTKAAVYRAVLRPEHKRFAYLRLGADELRLMVVAVVLSLLAGAVLAVLVAAAGVAGVLAGTAAAGAVGVLGFLIIVGLGAYWGVRLSLAAPMTFAERRITIFGSWTLTRGRFWPLLGMYVLVIVLYVIVWLLGTTIISAVVMVLGGGFHALGAMSNPDPANFGPGLLAGFVFYVVGTIVLAALQLALAYAPQAISYRDLAADRA